MESQVFTYETQMIDIPETKSTQVFTQLDQDIYANKIRGRQPPPNPKYHYSVSIPQI